MIRKTKDTTHVNGKQQLAASDYIGWHTINQELRVWAASTSHTLTWNDGKQDRIAVMDQSSAKVLLQALAEALNLAATDVSHNYPGFIAIQLVEKI